MSRQGPREAWVQRSGMDESHVLLPTKWDINRALQGDTVAGIPPDIHKNNILEEFAESVQTCFSYILCQAARRVSHSKFHICPCCKNMQDGLEFTCLTFTQLEPDILFRKYRQEVNLAGESSGLCPNLAMDQPRSQFRACHQRCKVSFVSPLTGFFFFVWLCLPLQS